MTSASTYALIIAAEEWTKAALCANDASHDWQHIQRVVALARRLTNLESSIAANDDETRLVIHLSAIMHDIADHKYGNPLPSIAATRIWLMEHGCPPPAVERILYVMQNIGFSTEVTATSTATPTSIPIELAIVQDADRLDAIGAIGIARVFTFGASRGRPLYDDADLDRSANDRIAYGTSSTCVAHFYEKLLKVRDMMKTTAGRAEAERRHEFMVVFLAQLRGDVVDCTSAA